MSEEPIFASRKDDIEITPTMARFGERSYPIANITAVETHQGGMDKGAIGVIALLISIVALFMGAFIVGVVAAIIAIAMTFRTKTASRQAKATLTLKTASGDEEVLAAADAMLVRQVKRAIEQAVAQRG